MALFRRNKQDKSIAELEEYYANEKSGGSGMAWLMAFFSLLLTIAVLALLFLGGRWVYRTFIEDDEASNTTSQTTSNESGTDSQNQTGDQSSGTGSGSGQGVVSDEAATTDVSNAGVAGSSTGTSNSSSSNTGPGLPNTGPDLDL